jgi:hypothetical protein
MTKLRHAFITATLDAGVPLREVMEAASHADPRTTMGSGQGVAGPARDLHRRCLHRRSRPVDLGLAAWQVAGVPGGVDPRMINMSAVYGEDDSATLNTESAIGYLSLAGRRAESPSEPEPGP